MKQRAAVALFLAVSLILLTTSTAGAAVTRLGGTINALAALTRGSAVAFGNNVYLVVSSYGTVRGQLLAADGTPAGGMFVIQASAIYTHFPRVAFSPHANGGQGAFLVTWHESDLAGGATSVHARLVSLSGALLSADTIIGTDFSWWEAGAAIAYATVSREFLVVWQRRVGSLSDISAARVSNSGALLANIVVSSNEAWERDPSVAYNPVTDEFLVVYAGASSVSFVNAQRVKAGTGALPSGPITLAFSLSTWITDVAYGSSTNQFLVAWYQDPPKAVYGRVVAADGSLPGIITPLSIRFRTYDGLALRHSDLAGGFLLISNDSQLGSYEVGGVQITPNGQPEDTSGTVLTAGNAPTHYPMLAASTAQPEWMVVAAHNNFSFTMGQRLGSGASGPPPPPPCAVAIGQSGGLANIHGGTGTVTVTTTPAGCAWSASSSASWLTLSNSSGTGTGAVNWNAEPNMTSSARSAVITIAGQRYSVTQCGAWMASTSGAAAVAGSGGVTSFPLTISGGSCGWTALSDDPWIHGTSGTGSGTATYTVDPNPTTRARIGHVWIGGQRYTVFQNGAAGIDERIAVGVETFPGYGGWLALHGGSAGNHFEAQAWTRLDWAEYNAQAGGIHPAVGNLDGDTADEIVVGLARGGAGWFAVLDDATASHRRISNWIQLPGWSSYNSANGETYPAVGDIDGDGRAEIVVGVGRGGGGYFAIFDDATTGFAFLGYGRVNWPAYNALDGSTHPAVADLDGNGRAEIVIGLGTGGGGWVDVFGDSTAGYAHRSWSRVNWNAYNVYGDGGVWPAAGDVDGDGQAEIVLGLGRGGAGWVEIKKGNLSTGFFTREWLRVNWGSYNSTVGVTHPAVGNIDGDAANEIVLGLGTGGAGWLQVFDNAASPTSAFPDLGFTRLALPEAQAWSKGTFPAAGKLR